MATAPARRTSPSRAGRYRRELGFPKPIAIGCHHMNDIEKVNAWLAAQAGEDKQCA
jgi:hypothetical protein